MTDEKGIEMIDNWKKVYSNTYQHKVEIVQAVLKDNDIESVIMNKKDSAYLFGDIELYVQSDNVMKAKQIIEKETL